MDIFSLVYYFSFLSPSLWETARYRLKSCLKGPLSPKQSINQPPKRGGERKERIDRSKNFQTTPTRTYCKRNRPLSYSNPNCRTACTGSLPSTIAPPDNPLHGPKKVGWLVGCFGFNGPLRQYFSLYRAVSQREGERKEK